MKLKTYNSLYASDLEDCVNNFIKDKKVIDIKFNTVPTEQCCDDEPDRLHFAYIMYEEYDNIKLENCLKEFQNHCFFTYRRYKDHTISEAEFQKDCEEKLDEVYKRVKYLLDEK